MNADWLDTEGLLLSDRCPLPLDAPFTLGMAASLGVSRQQLRTMERTGLVRRSLQGVYVVTQAPDTMDLRAAALSLVIPETAVVCDRTAAWLHGLDLLPRSALVRVPPVQVVHVDDTRVRRIGAEGRRRGLIPSDITVVQGIQVTTALRTALDLGRLLWRFDALGAIDGFLRLGVPHDLMAAETSRFRGFRGVVQLRALVPLGDGRAESMAESALRLHWLDAGLPRPEVQWWVSVDGVPVYRIDLALPDLLYAGEYDGEEFHTSDEDREADAERRAWLEDVRGWSIDVFDKRHVYDREIDPLPILTGGFYSARRGLNRWIGRRTA